MKKISLSKMKKRAENYFLKGEYQKAIQIFSLALAHFPDNKELKIGAILADMANENEEKAQAIYEYYQITKEIEEDNAENIIENLINSVDIDLELLNDFIDDNEVYYDENSIDYSDFISHVKQKGNFKIAYEDIMLSTKVLIQNRKDFLDFLDKLIENDYIETALNYAEIALALYPKDMEIKQLFNKVKKQN